MSETIKVGDVVPWADVPDGALVRHGCPCYERHGEHGCTVGQIRVDGKFECFARPWFAAYSWSSAGDDESVTIVAINLTGQESADDLRRLAEVFEVREALKAGVRWMGTHYNEAEDPGDVEEWVFYIQAGPIKIAGRGQLKSQAIQAAAERLHAAGWRPGMTAEDAARLLAEK